MGNGDDLDIAKNHHVGYREVDQFIPYMCTISQTLYGFNDQIPISQRYCSSGFHQDEVAAILRNADDLDIAKYHYVQYCETDFLIPYICTITRSQYLFDAVITMCKQ